ncbi:MAG: hypothetical protein KC964_17930 [Candidatus Omnitrophica bacterium]|nr:hypothetical protein [Candidatus Omnitrophota bacterium]MCA9437927.1 hypothetical protein [Candidatus Omnitrophota bacterium]MCA9442688.1 hypothetical protein [Candidatus Omnitrophota bacterium]
MIRIELPQAEIAQAPGSTLDLDLSWDDLGHTDEILINLFWTVKSPTSGGGAEGAVERSETLTGIGPSGSRKVTIDLPTGPYSYEGKSFSIQWGVEAIAQPSLECDRKKFVLASAARVNAESEDFLSSSVSEMEIESDV